MYRFPKTILVIHAHPDDTEAFCVGTLKLLADRGYKVVLATMTAGGLGGIDSTEAATILRRKSEALRAAAVLGAEYVCLDQRDGYVFDNESIRIATTDLIRRTGAGIVMTHLANDYHTDHRATAHIVEAASMVATLPNVPCNSKPLEITPLLYHTAPLGFCDPLGSPITPPHFFVNISEVMQVKMDMLACHESQIELMRVMHKMDNFFDEMKSYNVELGCMVGVDYAEAFWQHLGGGFQKDPVLQEVLAEAIHRPAQ